MEKQYLEIDKDLISVVTSLIDNYPNFAKIEDLEDCQGVELDDRMRIMQDLWEKKLIMTREPLEAHYDD